MIEYPLDPACDREPCSLGAGYIDHTAQAFQIGAIYDAAK